VLPVGRAALGSQISPFTRACSESNDVADWLDAMRVHDGEGARARTDLIRKLGAAISESFLEPIADTLQNCERLIVVSHGPTHHLPFHCLPWAEGTLLDTHTVSYVPSTSLLEPKDPGIRTQGEVVFAASSRSAVFDPSIGGQKVDLGPWSPELQPRRCPPLPWAITEIQEIVQFYRACKCLDEREFTKVRFLDSIENASIAHIAAHGVVLKSVPELSSLLLPNGEQISVHELIGRRLRADLLVMSACHSGAGKLMPGDDVLGFERALLAAGVRTMVLSLWSANDLSTMLLMREFHRLCSAGTLPADSLRASQRWLRRRTAAQLKGDIESIDTEAADQARTWLSEFDAGQRLFEHPFFWAPFICSSIETRATARRNLS
jgi:CHAT domain-containing protein